MCRNLFGRFIFWCWICKRLVWRRCRTISRLLSLNVQWIFLIVILSRKCVFCSRLLFFPMYSNGYETNQYSFCWQQLLAYPSLGNIIFHLPSLSLGLLLSALDNFFSLQGKRNLCLLIPLQAHGVGAIQLTPLSIGSNFSQPIQCRSTSWHSYQRWAIS